MPTSPADFLAEHQANYQTLTDAELAALMGTRSRAEIGKRWSEAC